MILGIDASQANREIRSGTEWYAFHLIQEFKKLFRQRTDVQVRLYARGPLQEDLVKDLPANFEVKILHWPLRYFWGQVRLSWEMLVHPPDVLFCPAHTIPLRHPAKTLTTLHDIGFEDNPELYDKLSLYYHRFSAKLAVRHAYHIFTISEFSKRRIIEAYHCPPQKITVTYLGYDQDRFRVLDESRIAAGLKKYQLQYKNYLLFVGRLEPKKNILGLVTAYDMLLKQMPNGPDLVLAGPRVNVRAVNNFLSERPGTAAKVRFLNYVPAGDLPALYAGAKVFLFPTLYEGFGLPILEAQATGTPVVTSNTASNPEIAGGGAILVDPRRPEEISNALRKFLESPELVRTKVVAGLKNLKKYSWHKTAEETLAKIL